MSSIPNFDIPNFKIRIFVIGYKCQGESIVILFYDQDKNRTFYSIVIDMYELGENDSIINYTVKILEKYKVKNVDYLFWTHPDKDHSKGIKKFIKEKQPHNIIIPYGVNYYNDHIKYCKGDETLKKEVDELIKDNSVKFIPESTNENGTTTRNLFRINSELVFYEILAPWTSIIYDLGTKRKEIHKNELSLFITLNIGEYKFIFSGDSEDKIINEIEDEKISDVIFIKIPHHGSSSSISLPSKIKQIKSPNLPQAVCTIFSNKRLPEEEVVNSYKKISIVKDGSTYDNQDNIFCTNQKYFNTKYKDLGDKDYGIVGYEYDLFGEEAKVKIQAIGNAGKI